MRKKILIGLLTGIMVLGLTGCGSTVETEKENDSKQTSMFIEVENAIDWKVVYHKETKVMYAVSDSSYNYGNFTLLVNPDGTPMLWTE